MTVCNNNDCTGCMLCLEVCKNGAIRIEDSLNSYNAVIDKTKCIECDVCHKMCPQNNRVSKNRSIFWYQGWNRDEKARQKAPSGGIGMALSKQFVLEGGYVCSCLFENGQFVFGITNIVDDVLKFGGSKYVKSNPEGIYSRVLQLLKEGKRVLFIGLPCQVAALKRIVGPKHEENLYLVDLICHGTPSPKLLECFLDQYSKPLSTINDIGFRIKSKMQIVVDDRGIVCKGVTDRYTIAFLNGLTYTQNCYSCYYASKERVSDITIGDSWGSQLSTDEVKKGISLIIVQSTKGDELLKRSHIELLEVDVKNAINNNEQLVRPMAMPGCRKSFFEQMEKRSFNKLVFVRYIKDCLKQDIKHELIKLCLIKS